MGVPEAPRPCGDLWGHQTTLPHLPSLLTAYPPCVPPLLTAGPRWRTSWRSRRRGGATCRASTCSAGTKRWRAGAAGLTSSWCGPGVSWVGPSRQSWCAGMCVLGSAACPGGRLGGAAPFTLTLTLTITHSLPPPGHCLQATEIIKSASNIRNVRFHVQRPNIGACRRRRVQGGWGRPAAGSASRTAGHAVLLCACMPMRHPTRSALRMLAGRPSARRLHSVHDPDGNGRERLPPPAGGRGGAAVALLVRLDAKPLLPRWVKGVGGCRAGAVRVGGGLAEGAEVPCHLGWVGGWVAGEMGLGWGRACQLRACILGPAPLPTPPTHRPTPPPAQVTTARCASGAAPAAWASARTRSTSSAAQCWASGEGGGGGRGLSCAGGTGARACRLCWQPALRTATLPPTCTTHPP